MFHPVGSLPPSVYWRRRLVLLTAVAVLVVLTGWVLRPGREDKPLAEPVGATSRSTSAAPTQPRPSTTAQPPSTPARTSARPSSGGRTSVSTPACAQSDLRVAAVTGQATYRIGDQPIVMLQVTNVGARPCVQDLADQQVELRIYNGESRVWGSHDCEVQAGTDPRAIAAGQSVRVSITWSGLSSQPKCAGTRQRVGAGTYTLYARLSGHEGKAAQFSIT